MGIFLNGLEKIKRALEAMTQIFQFHVSDLKKFISQKITKMTLMQMIIFGKFHKKNDKILNFNFPGSTIIHYYEKISR